MNGCTSDSAPPKTGTERWTEGADDTQKTEHRDSEGGTEVQEDGKKEGKERKRKEGRKKSRQVEEVPDDGVPYDTGWAWMIVLAGFLNLMVAAGYNRATFIFFVSFLEEFQAPVTETALLFGVKAAVNSIVGLFIMNAVVGRFGTRKTVFVGGVCISLSAILGSFATDVTSLILSQAVFHGLGMSMLNMPTTVLLGFYFKRRRSLANSITKCGVGVGAVAFPPIVTFLLRHYGLRGALLLMGALGLHTLVAAWLLRPTSFYKKRKQRLDDKRSRTLLSSAGLTAESLEGKGDREGKGNVCKCGQHGIKSDGVDCRLCEGPTGDSTGNPAGNPEGALNGCVVSIEQEVGATSCSGKRPHGQGHLPVLSCPLLDTSCLSQSTPVLNGCPKENFRRCTSLVSDQESDPITANGSAAGRPGRVLDTLSQSSVVRYMSAPRLELDDTPCVVTPADQPSDTAHSPSRTPLRTWLGRVGQGVRQVAGVLDFRLFHSPMFRLLVVFFICSPMASSVTVYLPAMAAERSLSQDQAAILLSIIGGLDFFCRLACGFLADLKIVKVSTMIGTSFTILGILYHLTRLLTSFSLLVAFAVVQGLLGGVAACLLPILIMEDIGLENTAKALGFMKLFMGGVMAFFHPLLGYIRDSTGSYDVAYHVIGSFTLLSAVIMFCLRFLPHTLPPSRDQQELSPLNANGSADKQTKVS